ncbi:MAG: Hsp70 family protein [Aristaeellaceae bacterium]
MIYFGFDLGDGESCVTFSRDLTANEPMPIVINGETSFTTAVGLHDGRIVIGRLASSNPAVTELRVCFKRRFLERREETDRTIVRFVTGVMEALRQDPLVGGVVDDPEQSCFIVGCPAGWPMEDRERYRRLMLQGGMQNVRIASESRAAFENALRRRVPGVAPELIEDCVLVIDIGSSTLDLAYVCDGQEHNVETQGDVKLGGGLMDEMILQYALGAMPDPAEARRLREFLDRSPDWHSRVMLQAREIKEEYFRDEEMYFQSGTEIVKSIRIVGGPGLNFRLSLTLSPEIVETYLIAQPHPLLDNQSFESRLLNTLRTVHQRIRKREPKLVILTGGPSRMRFFQDMCREEFRKSRVIVSGEPEFDIARGLAYAGSVDENAARLLGEIREYARGSAVEDKVQEGLPELIERISDGLSRSLMSGCVLEAFHAWRDGDVSTLRDFESTAAEAIHAYLLSSEGRSDISRSCAPWAEALLAKVQEDLDEMARRNKVAPGTLREGTLLVSADTTGEIDVAAQIVNVLHAIVTVITSVVAAMICGGSGVALLGAGPVGMVIGGILAAAAAILGRKFMKDAVMSLPMPKLMRRLFPDSLITSEANQRKTAAMLAESLNADAGLLADLVEQVGRIIDDSLTELIRDSEGRIVA